MKVPDRVWARTFARLDRSGECWLFTGSLTPNGYARVGWQEVGQRGAMMVHRMAYERSRRSS